MAAAAFLGGPHFRGVGYPGLGAAFSGGVILLLFPITSGEHRVACAVAAKTRCRARRPPGSGVWDDNFALLYRLFERVQTRQHQQPLAKTLVRFRQAGAAIPDGVIDSTRTIVSSGCNPTPKLHFGLDPLA